MRGVSVGVWCVLAVALALAAPGNVDPADGTAERAPDGFVEDDVGRQGESAPPTPPPSFGQQHPVLLGTATGAAGLAGATVGALGTAAVSAAGLGTLSTIVPMVLSTTVGNTPIANGRVAAWPILLVPIPIVGTVLLAGLASGVVAGLMLDSVGAGLLSGAVTGVTVTAGVGIGVLTGVFGSAALMLAALTQVKQTDPLSLIWPGLALLAAFPLTFGGLLTGGALGGAASGALVGYGGHLGGAIHE